MPVYVCKPGRDALEPWRHGIQVYAEPFAMSPGMLKAATSVSSSTTNDRALSRQESANAAPNSGNSSLGGEPLSHARGEPRSAHTTSSSTNPAPMRRLRHSEVVLVDDVVWAYQNYWLRLRWPGSKGGFAGFICLVSSNKMERLPVRRSQESEARDGAPEETVNPASVSFQNDNVVLSDAPPSFFSDIQAEPEAPSAPSPGYYAANADEQTMRCLRTGLNFPSSPALQLLDEYDDGLVPPVAIPSEGQVVFCRICRDGLHDDDDEDNTSPSDNPLLAPCECSGSMRFVHYLCVEQWRCRSRHAEARNGTHCETCARPYALPPPSSRPSQVEEEWLEAMPPHVMQALRQPHLGWQLGAALVRRRWLRPLAPIIVSPLVALYCRARRLLKKRGVSRRRWACSLCRRRARWKCVRCLRSYYCSRQCQNVSWHIVHKHVCYKPARFWWSVIIYGATTLFLIPGILKDPLLYDLLLSFIPTSFYVMAVLGGGVATILKRAGGIDLRGRMLELIVVIMTTWLVLVSWGVVWAFFGETNVCLGSFVSSVAKEEESQLLFVLQRFLLTPAKTYFVFWDKIPMKHERLERWFCTDGDGCFSHLGKAAPEILLGDQKCRSDLQLVASLWLTAGVTLAASMLWKRRRRAAGGQRAHQE